MIIVDVGVLLFGFIGQQHQINWSEAKKLEVWEWNSSLDGDGGHLAFISDYSQLGWGTRGH